MLDERLRRLRSIVAGRSDSVEYRERHDREGFVETVQSLKTVEECHGVIRPHGASEVVELIEQMLQTLDAAGDLRGHVLEVRPTVFVEQRMGV